MAHGNSIGLPLESGLLNRPDFSPPPTNPLALLRIHHQSLDGGSSVGPLSRAQGQAIRRILGGGYVSTGLRIMHGTNVQVLRGTFNQMFRNIFKNTKYPLGVGNPVRINNSGPQQGSLELNWQTQGVPLTKHHIIPKSRGGVNNESNYIWLPRKVHDDIHTVFGVLTPIEQLALLMLLFGKNYDPKFIADMSGLLLEHDQNRHYRSLLLRNNRIEYQT